jgi:hypothetical protein
VDTPGDPIQVELDLVLAEAGDGGLLSPVVYDLPD